MTTGYIKIESRAIFNVLKPHELFYVLVIGFHINSFVFVIDINAPILHLQFMGANKFFQTKKRNSFIFSKQKNKTNKKHKKTLRPYSQCSSRLYTKDGQRDYRKCGQS